MGSSPPGGEGVPTTINVLRGPGRAQTSPQRRPSLEPCCKSVMSRTRKQQVARGGKGTLPEDASSLEGNVLPQASRWCPGHTCPELCAELQGIEQDKVPSTRSPRKTRTCLSGFWEPAAAAGPRAGPGCLQRQGRGTLAPGEGRWESLSSPDPSAPHPVCLPDSLFPGFLKPYGRRASFDFFPCHSVNTKTSS